MKKVKTFSFKTFFVLCLSLLFFISCRSVKSSSINCPKPDEIKKSLDAIQPGINIESVEESPLPGLCEVIVKLSEVQKGIFYIDPTGKYIVSGSILDIKNFKNLTQEKLQAINKRVLSKDELSKLDKMVDIVYGTSPNVVYFITDPDCPHCKKAESILDKLVKEGKLTVKVILLPIEILHPDAKAKAISIVCNKKGFKELMEGYKSSDQCKTGKKKIEDNINFLLNELKISATPTFIFPDGEMKTGVLSENYVIGKFNPTN